MWKIAEILFVKQKKRASGVLFYGGLVEIFYLFFYKAYLLVSLCDHVNGHAGQRGKKQRAGIK